MMYYTPADVSFTPLFRLLDDFDNYSREVQGTPASRPRRSRNHRSALTAFHPKFDVRETENTYELHGELPGLERENVSIEFTEPQTIVIQGRVERSYGPDSNNNTTNNNNNAAGGATSETESNRRNSHHATVEDDPEDRNRPASSPTPAATSANKTEVANKSSSQTQEVANKPAQKNEPKYWLWERSVGEFSRSFSFPAPVDHDGVTASLSNGILSVVVPKAKKPVARRIEIRA